MGNRTRSRLLFMAAVFATIVITAQTYYLMSLQGQVEELREQLSAAEPAPAAFNPPTNPGSFPGWGAADPFTAMQLSMDALLGSSLGNAFTSPTHGLSWTTPTPDIALHETSEAYRIEVEVPEDSEVELQTDIEDNTVRLSGSVNLDSASNGSGLTAAFSARSQFSRSVDLPKLVNGLAMQTAREDDRIVITIPKA
ncbi:MAG: Hsp20/alpha crystallin family [Pseudomonadota bacterium]|jgi:HSP20 family molecular chaperone IbpA